MNGWIKTKHQLPEDGQEVTIYMRNGQIKQVVRDTDYVGGWKQMDYQGWVFVTWNADNVTHWRSQIFDLPKKDKHAKTRRKASRSSE